MTGEKTLPTERLELLDGWGGAVHGAAYVFRPSTLDQLKAAFASAKNAGRKITLRGAGRSYGDASLGRENVTIDLTRMNRILAWDPVSGIITCEPGVTIKQLWEYTIEDGWWPPIVPGTMFPTLGGVLAMNIHGKNNFKASTLGEHVLAFDFLAASGEEIHIHNPLSLLGEGGLNSPLPAGRGVRGEADLFYSIIGSFGMLGCFTSITLKLKKVYSGDLDVKVFIANNLHELFQIYDKQIPESDYLVGWIDAFATGKSLGRAIVHQANYLAPGVDPAPTQSLRLTHQNLPDAILGIVPKSIMWIFMRPFTNNVGVRFVNAAKFISSKISPKKQFRQAHAAFAFLLDYVPNWKKSYGSGGLIQFQSFIPKESAETTFRKQIELCQRESLPPFLAVFKKHRTDNFLMTHAVDGFSLALDFKVTKKNRPQLWKLTEQLNEIVLDAGGRFYMAKDATLTPEAFRRFLGTETLAKFNVLKARFDPEGILETELSKRLL